MTETEVIILNEHDLKKLKEEGFVSYCQYVVVDADMFEEMLGKTDNEN